MAKIDVDGIQDKIETEDLGRPLSNAEAALLRCYVTGEECEVASDATKEDKIGKVWRPFADPNPELKDAQKDLWAKWIERRPIEKTAQNKICARFLRKLFRRTYLDWGLIPDDHGIRLSGAWIEGELDLEYCRIDIPFEITQCVFEEEANFNRAHLRNLKLDGSWMQRGFRAHGVEVDGNLRLRRGFQSDGRVKLLACKVGGELSCQGAAFQDTAPMRERVALNRAHAPLDLDQAYVAKRLMLADGFYAKGGVSMRNADIGKDLMLRGACVTPMQGRDGTDADHPMIDFSSSVVGARFVMTDENRVDVRQDLDRPWSLQLGKDPTTAPATTQAGGKDQRSSDDPNADTNHEGGEDQQPLGRSPIVSLQNMRCRTLVDGNADDTRHCLLNLNFFNYDQIIGDTTFPTRKQWLLAQFQNGPDEGFQPQPFEQLAKILRNIGHEEDAKLISILKRRELVAASRKRGQNKFINYWKTLTRFGRIGRWPVKTFRRWEWTWSPWVDYVWSALFSLVLGFGYRPMRAVYWSLGVIVFGSLFFWGAYHEGHIAPNNPFILKSEEWTQCAAIADAGGKLASECWVENRAAGLQYQRFNSIAYSADIFLPFFDLHQESYWVATTTPQSDGYFSDARLVQWIQTALGYVLSAAAVAGFAGLIKRE